MGGGGGDRSVTGWGEWRQVSDGVGGDGDRSVTGWGGGWRQVSDGVGGGNGDRSLTGGGGGDGDSISASTRHLKVTNFSQYYHRYLKVRYQQCHRRLKITNISQ